MARMFTAAGTGSQQTLTPANKSKIPIYPNETALDADLANIPDNTLVATKGGHDDVIDQMKEYIREQNVLSDWEDITISTDSTNQTVVSHDGFIHFEQSDNSNEVAEFKLYINDIQIVDIRASSYASRRAGQGVTLPVKKGDTVYTNNIVNHSKARYYKLRDYKGR